MADNQLFSIIFDDFTFADDWKMYALHKIVGNVWTLLIIRLGKIVTCFCTELSPLTSADYRKDYA